MRKVSLVLLVVALVLTGCKRPKKRIIGEWFSDNVIDITVVITETDIEYTYNSNGNDIIRYLEIKNITNNSFETAGNGYVTYFFRNGNLYLSSSSGTYDKYERI